MVTPREKRPRRPARRRAVLVALVLTGIVLGGGVYVWRSSVARTPSAYVLAPESRLADWIRRAPPDIREAYRFAVANRDTLKKFPCFCGCFLEAGHTSNASCYIRDVRADGTIDFDNMSLG